MLSVLTIVVLLAASGATTFEEFSEQTLSSAALIDPKSPKKEARLTDSKIQFWLKSPHLKDENSIYFDASAKPFGKCSSSSIFHEITLTYAKWIPTEMTFNMVTSVGLRVVSHESEEVTDIRFEVTFGAPEDFTLVLVVPIYKIPESKSKFDDVKLKEWSQKAKVGTVSPISEKELSDVFSNGEVLIDLVWLEGLLKYGVRDSVIHKLYTKVYSTRPIVLPEDKLRNIIHYFNLFKKK